MLSMSVPWWEFVIRGLVVYLFLLVFLRLTGRRLIGQYAPFDLVLLLILSNAVQNSMNAGDNSLIGGLISAGTLILCHTLISRLTFRFPQLSAWIDGCARPIVERGNLNTALMREQWITPADIEAALREGGCLHLHEVERATLETNGQITIVLKNRDSSATSSASSSYH